MKMLNESHLESQSWFRLIRVASLVLSCKLLSWFRLPVTKWAMPESRFALSGKEWTAPALKKIDLLQITAGTPMGANDTFGGLS